MEPPVPPHLPSDPVSSRELSLRTFGNDGTGQGRRKRALERAAESRYAVAAKRRREAALKPDQIVTFMVSTAVRLHAVAARQMRAGHLDAPRADTILSRTVRSRSSGFIAIAPNAEDAAFLAAWLRSPGVTEFCEALAKLDAIAGGPAPAGQPIDLPLSDLVGSIETLERTGAADAISAARRLRTAGIVRCHARLFATAEEAASIADTVHALGASRILVNGLDRIAGRPEPRPH
jgi:hypothetical protein